MLLRAPGICFEVAVVAERLVLRLAASAQRGSWESSVRSVLMPDDQTPRSAKGPFSTAVTVVTGPVGSLVPRLVGGTAERRSGSVR